MKKSTKIWLIIATVLVVIGGMIFTYALASAGFDFISVMVHKSSRKASHSSSFSKDKRALKRMRTESYSNFFILFTVVSTKSGRVPGTWKVLGINIGWK